MKRHYLPLIAGLATLTLCIAPTTQAEPLGNMATPINYLVTGRDLHWLGAGVYGGTIERGVEYDGRNRDLEGDEVMGYVSIHPLRWLSAYGAGGYGSFDLDDTWAGSGEWVDQWAIGARFNLLDHDVGDPWIFEDRIRVSANAHYAWYDAEIGGQPDCDWTELKASVLVSIVNDVVGNKHFLPQTIALYCGPVYSTLGGDLEENEHFGFAAGLQTQLSADTALAIGVEDLDGTSITAGLDIRF